MTPKVNQSKVPARKIRNQAKRPPNFDDRFEHLYRVLSGRLHEIIHFHWYRQLWPAHSA